MSKQLVFKIKDGNGQIVDHTYTAENTWVLRNQELLRHEHYEDMAKLAHISLCDVHCDIQPTEGNKMMVCYRVGGKDIYGDMKYSVGSAAPDNVKMQGVYLPEMAFKRAYDSWVTSALGLYGNNIASIEGVDTHEISSEDISHPELVLVDFGKNKGKTLGEIWNDNPSFITDWLVTDKFVPKGRDSALLKQAGKAMIALHGAIANNSQQIIHQTSQPPVQQQQPMQTQPPVQQQQPMQTQPPVQQQTTEDINMLKSRLRNIWVERGYADEEAGKIINDGFKTNTITWSNITLGQVINVLNNVNIAFPIRRQQPMQTQPPVQQQQPMQTQPPVQQQQPMQTQPPVQQQPNNGVVYCDGNHDTPHPLKKAEIDFCTANFTKFGGKKYCMQCQMIIAKNTMNNNGQKF